MKMNHSADTCNCVIANELSELNNIVETIDGLAVEWNLSSKLKGQLNLVVEELITNIIKYAYADEIKHSIALDIYNDGTCIEIRVVDDGKQFNLLEAENKADVEASVEDRQIGGLGIHLVTSIMDDITYERRDGKNVLILMKNI